MYRPFYPLLDGELRIHTARRDLSLDLEPTPSLYVSFSPWRTLFP
jgi:hypothetical protein